MNLRLILVFIICLTLQFSLTAQTCCSGGVPVSSNIGFQSGVAKSLQLSLSSDFNKLSSLYSLDIELEDGLRERKTQSFIIRAAYSPAKKFIIEGLFPFIRQTRMIYSSPDVQSDFDKTFGIGDPAILLIYDLIQSQTSFRIGLGPKIPLGSSNKRNDRGLFLVEDLQPGSGSWGVIFFNSLEYIPGFRPSMALYANSIYSLNGNNPDSRGGAQTYHFGNDWQFIVGASDHFILFNKSFTPGFAVRRRQAQRDEINGMPNTGTGGKWWFLKFSMGINVWRSDVLTLNYELPVHSFVNETQLSPDRILNISYYTSIQFSKQKTLIQFPNF